MDDASDEVVDPDGGADTQQDTGDSTDSDERDVTPTTTLVEVTPGVAVVFGDVPEGLELVDLGLIPAFDREQLARALGSIGNIGTVVSNVAEAISSAQGLYRVNDATLALLQNGGELAAKDGAKLGAIFKNGELVAQARFIPAGMTAASLIAAVGPAVAMMALQMQLGEISGLVRTNIALTTQTLKAIRNEQWSELEGLSEAIEEAFKEARELESIMDSVWEPVAPSGPSLRKQLKLYRKNVDGHVQELSKVAGHAQRQYLESNAEAIMFDTHALLSALKAYAEYQALRASLARTRSASDESEAQLFELITRTTPPEIEKSLDEIRQLTASLVRELRIIAELPGRATVPLTKKRRDSKVSQLTCRQLLDGIEPLANKLQPPVAMQAVPDTLCAPPDLDLDPYLRVVRWFLDPGEGLRAVAFPYEVGGHNLAGVVPPVLAKRVDATWDGLAPGKKAALIEALDPSTFVAVTDRRIITATPKTLLRQGELGTIVCLADVKYVRPRQNHGGGVRPSISITTERADIQWMFPATADEGQIDLLAAMIAEGAAGMTDARAAIERSTEPATENSQGPRRGSDAVIPDAFV